MEQGREGRQLDHTSIQMEWDRVLGQADEALSHRPFRAGDPDWDTVLDGYVSSLREKASSCGDRTTIVQSPGPPRRGSRQSSMSHATTYKEYVDSGIADMDDLDEIKEETAIPNVLAKSLLSKTMQKVDDCLRLGKYTEAASLQRRAIEYRNKFAADTPVPTEVACRDEMKLSNIYRLVGTKTAIPRAEEVLISVIDRLKTDELDKPGLKNELLAELYHDLGRICLDLSKPGVGSEHLTEAFELMIESPTPPKKLLRSVGTMLYRIYINTGTPEVAEALDEDAEKRCGISLKTLAWCQEQGFDTELETFRFDTCDMRVDSRVKGMSPLHVAAKTANDEIIRHMLASRRLDLEVTEEQDSATPFLLACNQQDAVVVDLLLSNGARATACDKLRQNGLHLCQRATGGIGVAKRLLAEPGAVDVNALDSYQNTALHLAASMGNSKMVLLLLSSRADPNIRGPGGFTPLMAAVQATMKSQDAKLEVLKALFFHGADASLEYSGGQTAADMANDGQIRKVLKGWAREGQGFKKPVRRFTFPWKN